MMTAAEKNELLILTLLISLLALMVKIPEQSFKFSMVVLYCTSLLFCQSLVRDLWYLYAKRKHDKSAIKPIVRQCMCVESTVGVFGVVIGLLIFSSTIDFDVKLNQFFLLGLACAVLVSGFFIKDYVIEWNPWRLYKEKDHMNIIFSWTKP